MYVQRRLDSLGNKDVKVLKRLGKEYNNIFILGIKMLKIERS
jgi:hypothetical protein